MWVKAVEEDAMKVMESVALGLPPPAAGPHLTEQGSPLVAPEREKTEYRRKVPWCLARCPHCLGFQFPLYFLQVRLTELVR